MDRVVREDLRARAMARVATLAGRLAAALLRELAGAGARAEVEGALRTPVWTDDITDSASETGDIVDKLDEGIRPETSLTDAPQTVAHDLDGDIAGA